MVSSRTAHQAAPIALLGRIIFQARAQARLRQSDLAEALGIEQSSVSQWERGATTPTLAMFRRMVAVLGPWPLLSALLPPDHPDTLDHPDTPASAAETADQQVPPPDPQALAGLVAQGLSDGEIGERYGVPGTTVRHWRRAQRLASPQSGCRRPPKHVLARLIAEGLSDPQIGQRHGKSASTVKAWRHAYKLTRQQQRVDPAQALALWHQGLTINQIAQRLGRSHWTIRKLLQDATLTHQAATQPPTSGPGQQPPSVARQPTGQPVPATTDQPPAPPAPPHPDHQDDTDVHPAAKVAAPARQPT